MEGRSEQWWYKATDRQSLSKPRIDFIGVIFNGIDKKVDRKICNLCTTSKEIFPPVQEKGCFAIVWVRWGICVLAFYATSLSNSKVFSVLRKVFQLPQRENVSLRQCSLLYWKTLPWLYVYVQEKKESKIIVENFTKMKSCLNHEILIFLWLASDVP